MAVRKMSVSLDEEAVAAAKEAAAAAGMSLSAWLSDVALWAAKRENGLRACEEVLAELGPPSEEEIRKADAISAQIKRKRHRTPLSPEDIDRLLDDGEDGDQE